MSLLEVPDGGRDDNVVRQVGGAVLGHHQHAIPQALPRHFSPVEYPTDGRGHLHVGIWDIGLNEGNEI